MNRLGSDLITDLIALAASALNTAVCSGIARSMRRSSELGTGGDLQRQAVSFLRSAAEQSGLFVGGITGGDALKGVPQDLIAAGSLVDGKLLSNIERCGPKASMQVSI